MVDCWASGLEQVHRLHEVLDQQQVLLDSRAGLSGLRICMQGKHSHSLRGSTWSHSHRAWDA